MPGQTFLFLWCACGREANLPHRPEWLPLTRHQLLPRFTCQTCGQHPVDMRRVWVVPTRPEPAQIC